MEIPDTVTWLPTFKGGSLSFLECEALSLEKVDPELRAAGWSFCDSRWFDYVRLHPIKAFYYFCFCYSKAYGRYLESNINMDLRFSKGLKGDPIDSRELKQLFAAQRMADTQSIPYEFWLQELFNHFAANGWIRPPRPSHLARNEEAQEVVRLAWESRVEHMTLYAADPWFSVEQWCGHPEQVRYEDWIIQNIKLRQHKELALSVSVHEKRVLRIERAVQEFSSDLILQAQHWYDRNRESLSRDYNVGHNAP